MKRSLSWYLAAVLLFAANLMADAQSAPDAKATALPQGPGAQGAAQGATPTIQARSNLVILDVVVTDRNRRPIHGLKVGDFQLREGGAGQTIKTLEEHTPATAVAAPAMPKLPPGMFTNYSPVPANGPVNILLIDKLNTPLTSQPYLQDQIVTFLKTMKPGTRLAVFGLTTQLIYLQGFTSDPAVLLAALQTKKNSARDSPLLNPVAGDTSQSVGEALQNLGDDMVPAAVIANALQFEAEEASQKTQMRVRLTLDAMNTLARYLSAIPGRKNLVWFSGSFPISILPDSTGDLTDPFAVVADMSEEFRDTTNLLSRSQVSVYPIDARGIQTAPMYSATQSGSRYARDPRNFAKDNNTFSQQTLDEHSTMRQMARDTGGEAFVNTNGLSEAVSRAIDLGSSYYTLTYTPTNANYDGRFRKIEVDSSQHGAELGYRRGYYADPPAGGSVRKQLTSSAAAPPNAVVPGSAAASPEHQAVVNTMVRGAPGSTQILFKVLVVPAGPPTEAAVAEGNIVSAAAKGPFRRYSVNYAAVPQNILFQSITGGKYRAHLEFVVYVYSSDGGLVNRFSQSVQATLGPEDMKAVQAGGVQYHEIVSVPAKGEYFLRIGVHDLNLDRIGVVEVPVSAVEKLAVIEPAPSTPPQRTAPTLNTLPK